jgi:RND superfamily putative drug exporter
VLPGARIADYATTGDPAFITRDGRSTFALIYVAPATSFTSSGTNPRLGPALAAAAPHGWQSGLTGEQLLSNGAPSSKGTSLIVEAMIGSVGALAVLLLVFASFLAFLPLVIGGVSVLTTFLLVGGLTEITSVSQIVEFLIALIGLGVAIDYSLLVVSRWREERAAGRDNEEAVTAAMHHAGRAVVFSGLTVAIGLLSMIVLPVQMLRSVGIGGVLVPLVSVAVAITLLPVILATVGPRLDWPRLRTERTASRVFSAWARGVYRRRWIAAAGGVAVLAVLMVPALSLHLGEPGSSAQATSGPAHQALATLTEGGVPAGVLTPAEVLVRAPAGSGGPAGTAGSAGTSGPATTVAAVRTAAARVPGVYTAVAPATADYRRAGTAIVTVIPVADSSLPAGQTAMSGLESALLPVRGVVGVGGDGPSLIDFDHAVYGEFPVMLALIAVATFLLLTRAFRSVLLAAKAVVFNLASLAAAYGVLTWVWQDGHGSNTIWNIPATGAITMWVPLMVFAFLFGLSMDYEVFILTRIREVYDASGDGRHAVIEGLGRTGRLVTSAAAILMFSFLSMSTGPQTDLKILATGLGAGIVIDAVVVRCLLVPAMVALFGRANWWLPARLARLLRIPAAPAAAQPAAAGALFTASSR